MPNYKKPGSLGYDVIHKFGKNADVDTSAVEDIWDYGGEYPFPSAAVTTTVVSDSADDDEAGTGARTAVIIGLDTDGYRVIQAVTLDGTTPVELGTDLLRVHRAYIVDVGSGGVNAGNIQVKHSTTVLLQITAAVGQSLMCVFTIPRDYAAGWIASVRSNMSRTITSVAEMALEMRLEGKSWRIMEAFGISNAQDYNVEFAAWIEVPPMTDFRLRCKSVSANNTIIYGTFDVMLEKN